MFCGLQKVNIFCKFKSIYVIILCSEQILQRRWNEWAFTNFGDQSSDQKSPIQSCFLTKIIQCNENNNINTCNFGWWREMVQIHLVAMILFRFMWWVWTVWFCLCREVVWHACHHHNQLFIAQCEYLKCSKWSHSSIGVCCKHFGTLTDLDVFGSFGMMC